MKFLRYVEILDHTDPKYVNGNKLISKIYSIEEFKKYQNQSLQILDNESAVIEEIGIEDTGI